MNESRIQLSIVIVQSHDIALTVYIRTSSMNKILTQRQIQNKLAIVYLPHRTYLYTVSRRITPSVEYYEPAVFQVEFSAFGPIVVETCNGRHDAPGFGFFSCKCYPPPAIIEASSNLSDTANFVALHTCTAPQMTACWSYLCLAPTLHCCSILNKALHRLHSDGEHTAMILALLRSMAWSPHSHSN